MADKQPKVGEDGTHLVDRGGSEPRYSPNDDRGNAKNPNNDAFAANQANRSQQQKK